MPISSTVLKNQLMTLSKSGIHKEQTDKYRVLLDQVISNTGPELIETLKLLVEASK